MNIRLLERDEVETVWTIDRRQIIENIYYLEDGELVLKDEYYDMRGWPSGEAEQYTPILLDCFDREGTFYGAFENGQLIGVSVLDAKFIGKNKDQLQLKFLHVSHDYRGTGLGRILFEKAADKARALNAKNLYVSATPSGSTIHFYMRMGCTVTQDVNADLFELEPEDIHLECPIL
ncbi:MAG: GNAT family N-acetyltransferase [Chloroflexi bacterium]|nr:GNAT family N-acetyltransferase [Chloroflexota bacterium]